MTQKIMDKKEARKRIAKLRKVIRRHSYLYHVLDKPELSDAVFDSLKHELKKLEDRHPDLITSDSPTQRVSGKALDKFVKVRHKARMLSLEDVFYTEELAAWRERLRKLAPSQKFDYFAELKIDGFAISLVYRNAVFVEGSTRGDGRIGEDVTQNLKTIESIPLKLEIRQKLPFAIQKKVEWLLEKGEIEIRGEVYMAVKSFEKINQERRKQDLPLYANPRNTAAGSIRQLDPKIAASRQLDFLAYDIVADLGQKTHQEEHQIAEALGFRTGEGRYCSDLDKAVGFWREVAKKRERLTYQIDGVVVTVNSNELFKKLGVVGKAPRGAIAFKFPAEETTTVVENIAVQVGRTGALTPVAILKPVKIGGTTVSRATLHNEDEIRRLGLKIGDTVVIQRAGDVIPRVVKVIKKLRGGEEKEFRMPKKCPVCGQPTVRPKDEAVYRCFNQRCGAQQRRKIIHFVSKKAFDIDGLGPQIVNQLMDKGLVTDPADIFSLAEGDLTTLERFAEKSAANLIEAINQRRKISLSRFIYALGIRHIGEETAFVLARHFAGLDNLKKADLEELLKIKDVGEVVAKTLFNWFNDRGNLRFLDKLLKSGVEIEKIKAIKKKLSGKTFVLTGELEKFTRDQAEDKIRELGGDVSGSVSSKTDFVVIGKEPGSKYGKAEKLGVKIIGEKEFLEMIG